MSLITRSMAMQRLLKTDHDYVSPTGLVIAKKYDTPEYRTLRSSIEAYIRAAFNIPSGVHDIISTLESKYDEYPNITPGGAIAPKKEYAEEFNNMIHHFYLFFESVLEVKYIRSIHFPLNIRIKRRGHAKVFRPHDTRLWHTDAWAGESSEAVNLHIPLWGDSVRNYMQIADPRPEFFQTEHLAHLETYAEGAGLVDNYDVLMDIPRELNTVILSDLSTIHRTVNEEGCGLRISLDTTFISEKPGDHDEVEIIHNNRMLESMAVHDYREIGRKYKMVPLSSINDKTFLQHNFSHHSKFKMVYG